ncbi:Uncharacterised protein [Vibrio cholerae]|nr:Uncharacterised protein [Vibrio cholerae]
MKLSLRSINLRSNCKQHKVVCRLMRTAWRVCQSSQQMDSRKCKLHPFKVKSTLI